MMQSLSKEQLSLTGCKVRDTGWRPDAGAGVADGVVGEDLIADLRRLREGEADGFAVTAEQLGEEIGAVIEGRFELRCGDEVHVLDAGQGLIVPQGEPREWRVLSGEGVLYRVRHHQKSAIEKLEARLAVLEARHAIQALKAEYAAAADAKYTPDRQKRSVEEIAAAARRQANCFTEDGVWHGGPFGGELVGREAIFGFFCKSPWRFTAHAYQEPRITIAGETAVGHWRLWELGVRESDGATVLLVGESVETYSLTSQGWRIATMSFEKLHSLRLADAQDALRCLIPLGESA